MRGQCSVKPEVRTGSLSKSHERSSCVVVVVNGSFDAGLCVVLGGVAKLEVSEGVRALDRKSA